MIFVFALKNYPIAIRTLVVFDALFCGCFSSMSTPFVLKSFITVRQVVTGTILAYTYTSILLKGDKTFIWIKKELYEQ